MDIIDSLGSFAPHESDREEMEQVTAAGVIVLRSPLLFVFDRTFVVCLKMPFAMVTDYDRGYAGSGDPTKISHGHSDSATASSYKDQEQAYRYDSSDDESDGNEKDEMLRISCGACSAEGEEIEIHVAVLLFMLGCFCYVPWIFGATCFLKVQEFFVLYVSCRCNLLTQSFHSVIGRQKVEKHGVLRPCLLLLRCACF